MSSNTASIDEVRAACVVERERRHDERRTARGVRVGRACPCARRLRTSRGWPRMPRSSACASVSTSVTGMPASANAIAMPRPIVPAPITATRSIVRAAVVSGTSAMRGRGALGEERVAQCARLGRCDQLDEPRALERHARRRTASSRPPRRRRRTPPAPASRASSRACRARARSNASASGVRTRRSRRRLQRRASVDDPARERDRASTTGRPRRPRRTAPCRRTSPASTRRAGHDHVERGFDADRARQALRAACARAAGRASPRAAPPARRAPRRDSGSRARARARRPCRCRRSPRRPACALASTARMTRCSVGSARGLRRVELAHVGAGGKRACPRR